MIFFKDESAKIEIDFLKAEVAALKLKEMKNLYTKKNVEVRFSKAFCWVPSAWTSYPYRFKQK